MTDGTNDERIKFFEVRDRCTMISAMAIKLFTDTPKEQALVRRCGFDRPEEYVLLVHISKLEIQHDPYAWRFGRTMQVAHLYILEHWIELASGQVVDVEYILGETAKAKESAIGL